MAELEQAVINFVQLHHRSVDARVPAIDPSRARLQAALPAGGTVRNWHAHLVLAAAAVLILISGASVWFSLRHRDVAPNARLTPGATRPITRESVCAAQEPDELPPVAPAVAHEVFRRYGIHDPRPRSYEVDYLIPPSLGGSGDPQNLWPQPYASGEWNARVKDALEDRLRSLVCSGKLDLATAQHELARDWIATYKKYFRTDRPLLGHVAFLKDRPWE